MYISPSVKTLVLFTILILSPIFSSFASSEFFPHAQSLSNNGIIRLQSSEIGYRLGATITRAEATKLALSSAWVAQKSCNTTSSNSFVDVTSSLGDLCGYIEWAVQNGIITSSNRFYPNIPITRGDFASIIIKAFDVNYPDLVSTPSEGTLYFSDVSPSLVNATSIHRLATTGCINTNLTNFRPYASITRGEAFKIMACMMKKKDGGISATNPTINTLPSMNCSTFYWKDATHTTCQSPKQFCGAYMYQGLQTFETEQACTNSSTTNQSSSYVWSTTSYGACSKTCGEGVQSRTVICKRTVDNSTVADSYCIATGVMRPVNQKLCNLQICSGGVTSIEASGTSSVSTNVPALSRTRLDCPPSTTNTIIIKAEWGKDPVSGNNFQSSFYTPGFPMDTAVQNGKAFAYEFYSPPNLANGQISWTTSNYGQWQHEVTISQCAGDFSTSIPKECTGWPWHTGGIYWSTNGKLSVWRITSATGCNLGTNNRWYINVKPKTTAITGNAGILLGNIFYVWGNINAQANMSACQWEVPTGGIIYGKNYPDAYPENNTWRYWYNRLACTWFCGYSQERVGNTCVNVDLSGTYGSPTLVKKETSEYWDNGNAGMTWVNGRWVYDGGAIVNMWGNYSNYILPRTTYTVPTGKCTDNRMFYKLSNPRGCYLWYEEWRCTFDTEVWRVPCLWVPAEAVQPRDL